ncbi:MAG: cph1 5, partial [Pedosphaera sp.]|nr:cph1 5 [Pedosphaera sp.]
RPDLIILDHGRPAFPAAEALSLAREKRPEVPCISLLDPQGEQLVIEQFERGAKNWVLKPALANLMTVVRRCVKQGEADGQLPPVQAERQPFEEHLELFLEAARDYAIYMLDPEGRIMSWNVGARRLEGYEAEEITGQPFSTFFTADDIAQGRPQAELHKAEAHGHSQSEGWCRRKDGSLFWSEWSLSAVRTPAGGLLGFLQVAHDITRREQAEERLHNLNDDLEKRVQERTAQLGAANQELEAFSYSVSHDLRAPLRHISGFAEALDQHTEGKLDETGQEYLRAILRSANFLGTLVNGLLNFSRLGRKALHKTPVKLHSLVQNIIQELGSDTAGRTVDWQLPPLPTVRADALLLHQVLTNLISNALKFTRQRARARIEINSFPTENEHIIFVRDNGVGFDMQQAEQLFEVFHRLHADSEFEGTGIGLAIVRRIIQRHGGRTWAEGRPLEGATIYFSLPK